MRTGSPFPQSMAGVRLFPWADLAWVPEPGRSARTKASGVLCPAPQVSLSPLPAGEDPFIACADVLGRLPINLARWDTRSGIAVDWWWPFPFVAVYTGLDLATYLVPRWVPHVRAAVETNRPLARRYRILARLGESLSGLSPEDLDVLAGVASLGGSEALAEVLETTYAAHLR